MLNTPTKVSRNTLNHNNRTKSTTLQTAQHGGLHHKRNSSFFPERGTPLLSVPGESLTHITSYLDVPALLNLSRVNKSLHEHINNDSTWYRALLCQFLGVSPESDLCGVQGITLRRTESTWRKELVYRHITSVRWERSRTSAITYSPLNSRISDIRLVSENGLLASSTHHGIVSRSNPLSGKVFRGLFDATGTLNGLGIGNPDAEFSPNVCLCRVFAERSTAKILWGFTHGEVAVTTANKVTDPSRTSAAKFSRSLMSEQHNGTVVDAVWGAGGDVFLTAGIDGRVKLWDAAKVRCLWASLVQQDVPFPTSYPSHLDFDSRNGIVVAAFSGGDVLIWWGLLAFYSADATPQVSKVVIPPESLPPPSTDISHLVLDTTDGTSLLVHHLDSAHFHRYNINLATGEVETIKFGGGTDRSIKSLKLVTTARAKALPFVLTGDWLGSLSAYDWDAPRVSIEHFVWPVRRILAFGDGDAVSHVEWNPWVTVTGSSTGIVRVWDSLGFHLLRTFQPPVRGHTGDLSITLEREMIAIAFGDKVTAWKAGPVKKGNKVIHANKKGKNSVLTKWREQVDMYRDISESQREIEEEQSQRRAAYNREKDQLGSLEALGLNEQEALEYVLMLSRDEEERQDSSENPSTPPSFTQSRPLPPSSNVKVQTSPRVKREVWSAGVAGSSGSLEMGQSTSTGSDLSDGKEFPTVGESVSSRGSGVDGIATPLKPRRSSGGPPSAWSTPLKIPSKPTASPERVAVTISVPLPMPTLASKREEWKGQPIAHEESQEDRDLKLAIELSLAEVAKE